MTRIAALTDIRSVSWCLLFKREGDEEWRVWSERGTHHGASEDLAQAQSEGTWGELRIVRKTVTTEWDWDD